MVSPTTTLEDDTNVPANEAHLISTDEPRLIQATMIGNDTQIEPDHDEDDEGFVDSTNTSYVTSIASNIRKGVEENGRMYAAHGQHFYGLPIDEGEQGRNDIQHYKFCLIYSGRLFLAPIQDNPQRILDLGTGNGIWAMDVADQYPSAQVTGVDIAAVQPDWIPTNCIFEIDDVESDWVYRKNSFDFIHGREFLFAIRDWPRLIAQAYDHLKPGGYLELSATVPNVTSDDNTMAPDAAYKWLSYIFFDVHEKMGCDGYAPEKWKQQFQAQGFEDVHESVFKMPTNPWPKDQRLKRIGALELANFQEYLTAGFERGYVGLLGGNPAQLEVYLAKARKEVTDRSIHSYGFFWNVYGRKPLSAS